MKTRGFLPNILKSGRSVFSFKDFLLMWGGIDRKTAAARVHYYTRKGHLYPLRRGLYAKDAHYNKYELASKIYAPSYISFETVLGKEGIVFQFYDAIFVASYQSRLITCDGQAYHFRKIKTSVLTEAKGIEQKENFCIASPERALLDTVYLFKDYYFDDLSAINWKKVWEIFPIYGGNRRMERQLKNYYDTSHHNP